MLSTLHLYQVFANQLYPDVNYILSIDIQVLEMALKKEQVCYPKTAYNFLQQNQGLNFQTVTSEYLACYPRSSPAACHSGI